MSEIKEAREVLERRILEGDGRVLPSDRQAAFNNSGLAGPLSLLVEKVATRPYRITDEDINAAKAAGLTEDQIFEIVVCAAVGQASRQYDAAFAALEAAIRKD